MYSAIGTAQGTPVEDGLNILVRHSVLTAVPDGGLEENAHRERQLGCSTRKTTIGQSTVEGFRSRWFATTQNAQRAVALQQDHGGPDTT